MNVVLDVDPPALHGIQILGSLEFAEQDIELKVGYILVMGGELKIGSPSTPFMHRATITFIGDTADATGVNMGNRFLMAMSGGTISLHGHRRDARAWTLLNRHAGPGQSIIEVADPVNWRVGDEIVIAASGTKPWHAEQRRIVSIDSTSIVLNEPLIFDHFGQYVSTDDYSIDMRAEVGLLSRDIILQGDIGSELTRLGGHVMIMNADAFVEGVEFRRMGWYGAASRYPLHWHFSGNSPGEFAKNNSVHHCYHRGIVTHGANYIRIESNVLYETFSHGYVIAEDGNEVGNEYIGNLGLMVRRLESDADFAFPGEFGSAQSERHPGIFWATSPGHTVRNNRAAGAYNGIGFFYDGRGTATSVPPDFFRNNVAHSNYSNEGGYDRAFYRTKGWGLFVGKGFADGTEQVFKDFVAYKNTLGGAWLEGDGVVLEDALLTDNGSGVNLGSSTIRDSRIVGNTINGISPSFKSYGAINIFNSFPNGNHEPKIEQVTIQDINVGISLENDALDFDSYARNVTFDRVLYPLFCTRPDIKGAFRDLNGSITGSVTGTSSSALMFGRDYPFRPPSCGEVDELGMLLCPANEFVQLQVSADPNSSFYEPVGYMDITHEASGTTLEMYEPEIIDDWVPRYGYRQIQWTPSQQIYNLNFADGLPMEFEIDVKAEKSTWYGLKIDYPAGLQPKIWLDEILLPPLDSNVFLPGVDGWYFDELSGVLQISLDLEDAVANAHTLRIRQLDLRQASVDNSINVKAYPNPASDLYILETSLDFPVADASLSLFDNKGKPVNQIFYQNLTRGPQQFSISVESLRDGFYTYQLQLGNQGISGKLLKIADSGQ